MICYPQVPKVTQVHQARLAYLGPRALQVPQDPPEAEDRKALGSRMCSTASAKVRHVLSPMMIPWLEKLMRKSMNTIPHKQNP